MYHFFRVLDPSSSCVSFEQEHFEVEDSPVGPIIVVQPHQVERIRTAEHLRRHLAYGGPVPEKGLGSLSPLGDSGGDAGSSETGSQLTPEEEEAELDRLIAEEEGEKMDHQPIHQPNPVGTDNPPPDVLTTPPTTAS